MFKLETELGDILFSDNIINRIVTKAVESCDGKAMLMNYRGKYRSMFPDLASKMNIYNGEAGAIQFTESEEGLDIHLYVVLRLGASIKRTTKKIIDYIYEYVEKMTGREPVGVTVTVTGMVSKNIVKRNITISR